ncbi:MAG: glycosyltransferase family 4 protein [Opitutaceae bacterium]|nr:glycosyltransferase family 4 protein [Opitutaceae bacterium]
MAHPPVITGEIEGPRPLRAPGGRVVLTGWCLCDGTRPAGIRLVTPVGTLVAITGLPRDDTGSRSDSGFRVEGMLPAGVHLARLEVQSPDGDWLSFRSHALAVEAEPFQAKVEAVEEGTPLARRQHVAGWALHPGGEVAELSIRYAHQEIACTLGLPRTDVPRRFPHHAQAARCGFQSQDILGAGTGPLRVKARLRDGRTCVSRTPVRIAVPTDPNHPPGFSFTDAPARLPRLKLPVSPAATPATTPLNILFVLPGSFAANHALHVAALANELCAHGHDCAVAVAHDPDTMSHLDAPRFRGLTHDEAVRGRAFRNGREADLIHAWTTREIVRRLVRQLLDRFPARVCVHLEDNESLLLAQSLHRSVEELAALPDGELDALVPPALSHPRRSMEFLRAADGVTVIVDRLREFVPAGRPCHLLWPAADARHFGPLPLPADFRRLLDPTADTTVLFYHGNIHPANAAEMRELYAAVLRLNESGHPTTLIRTGLDSVDGLGALADRVRPHVLALGQVLHHRHLPALMSLADIFVQPGWPDAFNRYRFPSKLPEFFALGRPVVLPRVNLGEQLRHGLDAYVLERADAAGITAAVVELRRDRALAARLAAGALAFARAHFSWRRSAEELANFYATLAASHP